MNTTLEQRVKAFVQLSKLMESLSQQSTWPGFDCVLTEEEYQSANEVVPPKYPTMDGSRRRTHERPLVNGQ